MQPILFIMISFQSSDTGQNGSHWKLKTWANKRQGFLHKASSPPRDFLPTNIILKLTTRHSVNLDKDFPLHPQPKKVRSDSFASHLFICEFVLVSAIVSSPSPVETSVSIPVEQDEYTPSHYVEQLGRRQWTNLANSVGHYLRLSVYG